MKHIKLFENFKSDEDIKKEFDGMKLSNIKLEAREMKMYGDGSYEADLEWSFPDGDEHVGGGADQTAEDFVYNVPGKAFQYTVNNWYPGEVYAKMVEMIKAELKKKYGTDFEHMKNIDFIRKFK